MAESSLTFRELRMANSERARKWDNGATPPLSFAACELAGETGELCNVIKKIERSTMGMKGGLDGAAGKLKACEEIGDVVICLDLIAWRLGLSLEKCVASKFNATSIERGFDERLEVRG